MRRKLLFKGHAAKLVDLPTDQLTEELAAMQIRMLAILSAEVRKPHVAPLQVALDTRRTMRIWCESHPDKLIAFAVQVSEDRRNFENLSF